MPETGNDENWVRIASTRAVQLRGDEFTTKLSKSALEDMVMQIEQSHVWFMAEHLEFIPPFGLQKHAELREREDGETELYVRADFNLPRYLDDRERDFSEWMTELTPLESPALSVQIQYDRRNFIPDMAEFIERDSAGLATPVERQSELPPLAYAIVIPVAWGVGRFLGSFLDQLGKAAGQAVADKIASWSKRSRRPERTAVLKLDFQLPDNAHICGFTFAKPDEISAQVQSLVHASEELAVIAGIQNEHGTFPGMKLAAFFLEDGLWRLGWWTDGEMVIVTTWFNENQPDIEEVLGHKPFWETQ